MSPLSRRLRHYQMRIWVKGKGDFSNQLTVSKRCTLSEDQIRRYMAKMSSNSRPEISSRLQERSHADCLGKYEKLEKENLSDCVALKRKAIVPEPSEESLCKRSKVVSQVEVCFERALQRLKEEVNAIIQSLSQANLVLEQQIKERDTHSKSSEDNERSQSQATKAKRSPAAIAELIGIHQKCLESLEIQLGEAMSEQNRARETTSSLPHDSNNDKHSNKDHEMDSLIGLDRNEFINQSPGMELVDCQSLEI